MPPRAGGRPPWAGSERQRLALAWNAAWVATLGNPRVGRLVIDDDALRVDAAPGARGPFEEPRRDERHIEVLHGKQLVGALGVAGEVETAAVPGHQIRVMTDVRMRRRQCLDRDGTRRDRRASGL